MSEPRDILEALHLDRIYFLKWTTFVVSGKEKEHDFVPDRLIYQRRYEYEESKTILSKYLYELGGRLQIGSHNIILPPGVNIDTTTLTNLNLANYPVRSKKQLEKKVIIGTLNNLAIYPRSQGIGYHQMYIYDEIIKSGWLTDSSLKKFSLYYAVRDNGLKIKLLYKPLKISFC